MTIAGIGQSGVINAVHHNARVQPSVSAAHSNTRRDTAEISKTAKNLAAQYTEGSPQEEAMESMSEKLSEQMSGIKD